MPCHSFWSRQRSVSRMPLAHRANHASQVTVPHFSSSTRCLPVSAFGRHHSPAFLPGQPTWPCKRGTLHFTVNYDVGWLSTAASQAGCQPSSICSVLCSVALNPWIKGANFCWHGPPVVHTIKGSSPRPAVHYCRESIITLTSETERQLRTVLGLCVNAVRPILAKISKG